MPTRTTAASAPRFLLGRGLAAIRFKGRDSLDRGLSRTRGRGTREVPVLGAYAHTQKMLGDSRGSGYRPFFTHTLTYTRARCPRGVGASFSWLYIVQTVRP